MNAPLGIALLALMLIAALNGGTVIMRAIQDRLDSFTQNCAEAGGHIYGVNTVFCWDDEGHIVEVYP